MKPIIVPEIIPDRPSYFLARVALGGVPLDSRDLNVTEIDGFLLEFQNFQSRLASHSHRKYLGSIGNAVDLPRVGSPLEIPYY